MSKVNEVEVNEQGEIEVREREVEVNEQGEEKETKVVKGYNKATDSWHCLTCGVDMGPSNPRQLCGKWVCDNSPYEDFFE